MKRVCNIIKHLYIEIMISAHACHFFPAMVFNARSLALFCCHMEMERIFCSLLSLDLCLVPRAYGDFENFVVSRSANDIYLWGVVIVLRGVGAIAIVCRDDVFFCKRCCHIAGTI